MVAIVDYGVGNLFSLGCSLRKIGAAAEVTGDPDRIRAADRILLPGVGAFGDAMEKLRNAGLVPVLREAAAEGRPLLGVCLGMQLLFEKSFEYGEHAGLGLLPGEVRDLREGLGESGLKVPHMGWNSLEFPKPDPLFRYVSPGEYVYYVHSYAARNCDESVLAVSQYGPLAVTGAAGRGNVRGTQFHPEKSGDTGLRILKAFAEL